MNYICVVFSANFPLPLVRNFVSVSYVHYSRFPFTGSIKQNSIIILYNLKSLNDRKKKTRAMIFSRMFNIRTNILENSDSFS